MVARYLVTGANGFIGRVVCAQLQAAGGEVHALLRRPAAGPWDRVLCCDLAHAAPASAWFAGLTGVVHLAGVAHTAARAAQYQAGNIGATAQLVHACQIAAVPSLIFVSSVKAMGETTPPTGMDETTPCQPTTAYGQSKYAAEDLVLKSGLARPVVLRLPLVYGSGVKGNLATWLRLVRRGLMPRLPETGNRRSLVHVADVAQAVVLALNTEAAARQVYIISETRAYSAGEIDTLLRQALGQAAARWPWPLAAWRILAGLGELAQRCGLPAPLDLDRYHKLFDSAYYPATKARRELGFIPQFDLVEGVRQMALTP